MTVKNIDLTGSEAAVTELHGANAAVKNNGTSTIYVSAKAYMKEGDDGVLPILSGESAMFYGTNGTLYLKGTGSVVVIGTDFTENPFKPSSAGSGAGEGVDLMARAELNAHVSNTDIHLAAAEVCNPNLLLNPDFRVNQRGVSGTVTETGYFVDMWRLDSGSVTINDDGSLTLNGSISQSVIGAPLGASCSSSAGDVSYIDGVLTITAYGEIIRWAKLEYSMTPTMFVEPQPSEELLKCQHYFYRLANNTANPALIGMAVASSASIMNFTTVLPVEMNDSPRVTVAAEALGYGTTISGAAQPDSVSRNGQAANRFITLLLNGSYTAGSAYIVCLQAGQKIDFSAEP